MVMLDSRACASTLDRMKMQHAARTTVTITSPALTSQLFHPVMAADWPPLPAGPLALLAVSAMVAPHARTYRPSMLPQVVRQGSGGAHGAGTISVLGGGSQRLPPNAPSYCSGLKPTSSLPPTSSTGRLIIDGCAVIRAIAFFSVSPSLSLSGSARKVVPARLSSVSQPTSRDQPSSRPRSMPAAL